MKFNPTVVTNAVSFASYHDSPHPDAKAKPNARSPPVIRKKYNVKRGINRKKTRRPWIPYQMTQARDVQAQGYEISSSYIAVSKYISFTNRTVHSAAPQPAHHQQ